jgi:hypothetical protein
VTVAILLVLLAGAISLATALAAFIIARGSGKSIFRATCYAAATFVATSTLLLLALTFVESARQDEHAHAYAESVRVYGPPMIISGNNDSLARTPSFGKAPCG